MFTGNDIKAPYANFIIEHVPVNSLCENSTAPESCNSICAAARPLQEFCVTHLYSWVHQKNYHLHEHSDYQQHYRKVFVLQISQPMLWPWKFWLFLVLTTLLAMLMSVESFGQFRNMWKKVKREIEPTAVSFWTTTEITLSKTVHQAYCYHTTSKVAVIVGWFSAFSLVLLSSVP